MSTQEQIGVRPLETADDFAETRLEAIGFIFHGMVPEPNAKRMAVRAGTNLLHFARCVKLDKVGTAESKFWYRSVALAKTNLDEAIGTGRWKWCKICEREVTQRVLNER
jgi:hypothetical protein